MIEWKTENPNHIATPCTLHKDCDHIDYSEVRYYGYDNGLLVSIIGYDRSSHGKLQLVKDGKASAVVPVMLSKLYWNETQEQIWDEELRMLKELVEEIYTGEVASGDEYYKLHTSYKQGLIDRKKSLLETCKYDFIEPTFN